MTAGNRIPVRHEREQGRFIATEDGHTGYVDYVVAGGVLDIRHTIVPDAIGGRGIAGQLVRAALDFARAEGYRVRPSCEYASVWMTRHPDYDGLRAA